MADGLTTTPNTFQRLMLQWERFAPYNAGQYATLTQNDVDQDAIRRTWRDTSVTLGLQQIGQHPDAPIAVGESVEPFVTAQLNRPFVADEPPLRPFVVREGGRLHVGVIYRHVVADSASIRLVMRAWVERLLSLPPSDVTRRHVGLLRDDALKLFGSNRRWSLVREAAAEFARLGRLKRVRRLPASATPDSPVGWRRVELSPGLPQRLRSYSRRHGVKVNDLFVAAAAMACDPWMPHEENDDRPDIAIGTIADVRPADRPPDRHFGLWLGFLQTFWRWQDLRSWPHALFAAAAQSRVARRRHLAAASELRLWTAACLGDRMDDADLATFYRKRCPLAAGISNVNLQGYWQSSLHPRRLSAYTRISPLGPMLPLVLTPTSLGDTLHLGVTWRTGVVDRETVDTIITAFADRLEHATA